MKKYSILVLMFCLQACYVNKTHTHYGPDIKGMSMTEAVILLIAILGGVLAMFFIWNRHINKHKKKK